LKPSELHGRTASWYVAGMPRDSARDLRDPALEVAKRLETNCIATVRFDIRVKRPAIGHGKWQDGGKTNPSLIELWIEISKYLKIETKNVLL